MRKTFVFIAFLYFFSHYLYSQTSLLDSVNANRALIMTDPKKGFEEAKKLENISKEAGDYEAELLALTNQCEYYVYEIDFKSLKLTAEDLFKRSSKYKLINYQAIAKYYLFQSFLFSDLPHKAKREIDEGMQYVFQAEERGILFRGTKMNYYIGYSNYYLHINDIDNQIKYIRLSGEEIDKMPEGKNKHNNLNLYYSNLAQAFREGQQMDSAKYYAHLSNSAIEREQESEISFMNNLIIGEALMKSGDYQKAVYYFLQSEGHSGSINHINRIQLYDNFILSYEKLSHPDSISIYQSKKDALQLQVSKSQNSLLTDLLSSLSLAVDNKKTGITAFISFLVLLLVLFFVLKRKRRDKIKPEESLDIQNRGEKHIKLIELVKENNSAFMTCFTELYPNFTEDLLAINPNLTPSELEMCAMLKLRIPSKDIARYTFIAPKTVQNKRYIIRKKLEIKRKTDLYEWFEQMG